MSAEKSQTTVAPAEKRKKNQPVAKFDPYSEELDETFDSLDRMGFIERGYRAHVAGLPPRTLNQFVAVHRLLARLEKGPATFHELMQSSLSEPVSVNAAAVWDQVIANDIDLEIEVKPGILQSCLAYAQKKGNLKQLTKEKFGIEVENGEMEPYVNYHFFGSLVWSLKKYGSVVRHDDGRYEFKNPKVPDYLRILFELMPDLSPTKTEYLRRVDYVEPTPE